MSDDLVTWVTAQPWWSAADLLAREGSCVVVCDPSAPEECRNLYHSGCITYHTSGGGFAPAYGMVHVIRGKKKDVTFRIIRRRSREG